MINNINDFNCQSWLQKTLSSLPSGSRLLDAGAGELRNKRFCAHLDYVSQDFCQYKGNYEDEGGAGAAGLQHATWDTSRIDIVSDITGIPAPDASFDAVLCSEVLEHIPEPHRALDEFFRLLKVGGVLVITAPFNSLVHMAPYYFCTGFSRYWYEHHLTKRGFLIKELVPNADWFCYLEQELTRLGGLERQRKNWCWPFAYAYALLGVLYFRLRGKKRADDLGCFGWHCVAEKR